MNPDANPDAAAPVTPARLAAPPARGGLSSALKVALPLVLLVGVVFGITYITMYAPRTDEGDNPKAGLPGTSDAGEPPLRFFTTDRRWDPPRLEERGYRDLPLLAPSALKRPEEAAEQVFPYSLQDRTFQGVYEASADIKRTTQFWFENRNPQGVTLGLVEVNCGACSSGRVAAIPPEAARDLLQFTAVGALPTGPFGALKVGLVEPAAALARLQWDEQSFEHFRLTPVKYRVPAATNPDKWSPQWGILELQYKATTDRSNNPLRAGFAAQVDGRSDFATPEFAIAFQVAPPCAAAPPSIDAGRVEASSDDRTFEFVVYSATRGPGSEFGDLEWPSYKVEAPAGADPTPFVEVVDGKTVRATEADLAELQNTLRQRVRSAYKFTVVVRPKVGGKRADIGRLDRTISITAGGVTQQVQVTATVRGPVWIDGDRTEVTLPSFPGKRGLTKSPTDLTTERAGMELAVVKEECRPKEFVYELQKQPDRGGEGHYRLLVTIPPGRFFGAVKGEAVLAVKGPDPQKMRIPVTASGTFGQ